MIGGNISRGRFYDYLQSGTCWFEGSVVEGVGGGASLVAGRISSGAGIAGNGGVK